MQMASGHLMAKVRNPQKLATGDDVIVLRGWLTGRTLRVKHVSKNGRWVYLHYADGIRKRISSVERIVPMTLTMKYSKGEFR